MLPTSAGMTMRPRIDPRRAGGNQVWVTRAALGVPPPRQLEQKSDDQQAQKAGGRSVRAVNTDHQMTILVSTEREPYLSPQWPVTTSKSP